MGRSLLQRSVHLASSMSERGSSRREVGVDFCPCEVGVDFCPCEVGVDFCPCEVGVDCSRRDDPVRTFVR